MKAQTQDYLDGGEPEDVAYNMDMQLMLRKKNERYYEINKKQITERAVKLEAAGKYRTLLNRGNPPRLAAELF